MDGTNYFTATPLSTTGNAWPFDAGNFYLMLNAAVGGPGTAFTGHQNPIAADYPTTTEIEYVRVYGGSYNYVITGPSDAGFGALNVPFSVVPLAGATYFWTAPAGAVIAAGQGTPAVQINWGTASGPVTVTVAAPGCAAHVYTKYVQAVLPLPVGTNLALRKPAFASSEEGAGTASVRLASLAVDGDATTRWGSAFSTNEWLYVDLQNTYDLTGVVVRWEAAYATAYQIQTSLDGTTWSNRYSTNSGNGGLDNLVISGLGRYVRVNCQQRATQYGYSLYELEVYGALPPTGVSEEAPSATRLYPNPVTEELMVTDDPGLTALTLTDAQGRRVRQWPLTVGQTTATLPMGELPGGLYLLHLQHADGRREVRKVIKQ